MVRAPETPTPRLGLGCWTPHLWLCSRAEALAQAVPLTEVSRELVPRPSDTQSGC